MAYKGEEIKAQNYKACQAGFIFMAMLLSYLVIWDRSLQFTVPQFPLSWNWYYYFTMVLCNILHWQWRSTLRSVDEMHSVATHCHCYGYWCVTAFLWGQGSNGIFVTFAFPHILRLPGLLPRLHSKNKQPHGCSQSRMLRAQGTVWLQSLSMDRPSWELQGGSEVELLW